MCQNDLNMLKIKKNLTNEKFSSKKFLNNFIWLILKDIKL